MTAIGTFAGCNQKEGRCVVFYRLHSSNERKKWGYISNNSWVLRKVRRAPLFCNELNFLESR